MGIGVQGLAKVFCMMKLPWSSKEAAILNHQIFETIYHAALEKSSQLARHYGKTYETYEGSPASKGLLHHDLFLKSINRTEPYHPYICDWDALRQHIKEYGLYNSLLIAPMPTAGTSQLFDSSEGIDPIQSNLFVRRVLAGEFYVINPELVHQLDKLRLWNDDMKNKIIYYRGSIKDIVEIPNDLKAVFQTAWEISPISILRLAEERATFIDQSQSLNAWMADPTEESVSTWHMHGWKHGLKTGMYYLRRRAGADPLAVTVDMQKIIGSTKTNQEKKRKRSSNNNSGKDEVTEDSDSVTTKRQKSSEPKNTQENDPKCSKKDASGNCFGCGG